MYALATIDPNTAYRVLWIDALAPGPGGALGSAHPATDPSRGAPAAVASPRGAQRPGLPRDPRPPLARDRLRDGARHLLDHLTQGSSVRMIDRTRPRAVGCARR